MKPKSEKKLNKELTKKASSKSTAPVKQTSNIETKKKFFKKKKTQEKEKKLKLIVNLAKCSQNWHNVASVLPKPVFKRQSLKQPKLDESKPAAEKKEETKIWFEVDKTFLNEEKPDDQLKDSQEKSSDQKVLTKALAIDCEMVGVGENGKDSILARVSIVNQHNECVYDKYVIPTEPVTDYRTSVSGIRPSDLKKSNNALPFSIVQKEVSEILETRILVGHALHNDLKVLFLSHPKKKIRDTQKCKVFRQKYPSIGGLCSLKKLAQILLGISIQEGEHNSVKDAQAAMMLYNNYKKEWEAYLRNKKLESRQALKANSEEAKSLIKDGVFNNSDIQINTGNENHKRYLQNKLKKRPRFVKKFIKN